MESSSTTMGSQKGIITSSMELDQAGDVSEQLNQERTHSRRASWLRQELLRCPDEEEDSPSSSTESNESNSQTTSSDTSEERNVFVRRWQSGESKLLPVVSEDVLELVGPPGKVFSDRECFLSSDSSSIF